MMRLLFYLFSLLLLVGCTSKNNSKIVDLEMLWNKSSYVFMDITNGEYNKEHIVELKDSINGISEFSSLDSLLSLFLSKEDYLWISEEQSPVGINLKCDGQKRYEYDVIPTITNKSTKTIISIEFKVIARNSEGLYIAEEGSHCKWFGHLEPNQTIKERKVWTVDMKTEVEKDEFKAYNIIVGYKDGAKWHYYSAFSQKADDFMKTFHSCKELYEKNNE